MNTNDLAFAFAREHLIHASGLLSLLMPQTSNVGFGLKDLEGRYQLANRTLEMLTGQNAGQLVGQCDTDLFAPEVAEVLQASDQEILAGDAAASNELDFSLHGVPLKSLWLKFPVTNPEGKLQFIGVVMLDMTGPQDVSALRQSLEQLRKTNQDLQKTLLELDRLARTDKLTGAWNRRRLEEVVVNEMARLKRYDQPLSLLILDIDLFKQINDAYGHAAGDQVLAELAVVILATIRSTDSLTRWGGEEFIVLCPNTTYATVAVLAERLRERIARATFTTARTVTVSIGAAECLPEETWAQWFERADAALYRAKTHGRNQVQISAEIPARTGAAGRIKASPVKLSWHAAYECGHPVIDEQHRALFDDANQLLTAVLLEEGAGQISARIDALINDVVKHFQDEEVIFTAAGFPHADEHAKIHRKLVEQAAEVANRFHAGALDIGELFQFLAHDVVARHMLGADREFFPYLRHQPT